MAELNVDTWSVKELNLGRDAIGSSQWPKLSCSAANQADLTGSLHVTGDTDVGGNLHVAGTLTAILGPNMVGPEHLAAAIVAKLVTNGDRHDHSGGDGARIKHSSLALDGGTNPHSTTAADVRALSLTGGTISGNLQVTGSSSFSGNVGIGTLSPVEALEVNGRIKSGALTIGPWPANPNRYMFFGTNALDQANPGNYALLQEAAATPGITFLNSPASIQFRIKNADKMVLANNGNIGIGTPSPTHKFHVVAQDAVGLFESTGTQAYLRLSTKEGLDNRVEITNRPGGRLSLWTTPAGDVFNITKQGRVGIGTISPQFLLDVAGVAHATSFPVSSDDRFKANVTPLTNILEKLEKIHGVSFNWNELYESLGRSTGRREIGVIAQEVEAVFPELVTTWGDDDYRAIDYGRLTAVLIEAVKELNANNEALKRRSEAAEKTFFRTA